MRLTVVLLLAEFEAAVVIGSGSTAVSKMCIIENVSEGEYPRQSADMHVVAF